FAFFLYGYVHRRALHSFPTRRSSDLFCGLATSYGVSRVPAHAPERRFQFNFVGEVWSRMTEVRRTDKTLNLAIIGNAFFFFIAADRKSTRLNSSHRTISYAVFCLKKK